jgi:hypothetical protein
MAMGRRRAKQDAMFIPHQQLRSAGHPFYVTVERVLATRDSTASAGLRGGWRTR